MNISLRKANAIQTAINDAIKDIKIDTTIMINEFQSAESALEAAGQLIFANDSRRQQLLFALYNIRGLVGTANVKSGIDTKLATAALLEKRIAQLNELADGGVRVDAVVLAGRLEKIRKQNAENRTVMYGISDSVPTGVLTQEQIDKIKLEIKNLKKQKLKINDEILELNIKTEIPLSPEVVSTLTAEGLI